MNNIEFGSIAIDQETNRVRLTGSNSGIDTEAMVTALTDAKKLPALRIENRISEREAQSAAYSELEGLLSSMQSSLDGLRNPPGILGKEDNLFERKAAFFSSDTTTQPGELIGVSVANNAAAGSFKLQVEQLATARKATSDSATSATQSLADAFNGGAAFAGGFTLGLEGGPTADIVVDPDADIYALRDAINAETDTTDVTASVLKVADNDFRLVLTGGETGRDIVIDDDAGTSGVRETLGIWDGGAGNFKNSLQPSQPAIVTIDNISVTRTENTIDDLVTGVTIDLLKAEPGTTLTVDVEQALGDAKTAILNFVESYNAVRDFIDQQRQVGENGEVDKLTSPLFADSLLRQVSQDLVSEASASVSGLAPGVVSTLADIGIKVGNDNKLTLDEGKLDEALLNKSDEVRNLFEFQSTTSSSTLRVFERSNALADTDFEVVVVDADNDGIPESATIGGEAAVVHGQKITGADGSAFSGTSFLWVGTGDETIQVTATQGLADRLYNSLEGLLDPNEGRLKTSIDALTEQVATYRDDIAAIEERAEAYRETLIARFAALETALSFAESMMSYISANTDAMFADR